MHDARALVSREVLARVYARFGKDEIADRAAALAYYFLLALFPTLLFLTALLGSMPVSGLFERLMGYAGTVLPPDVASLLARTMDEVVAGAGGGLASLGALGTLWAASRGIRSIIAALNVVYDVPRARSWWRRQLVSVLLTLIFCVFALVALLLLVFGERIGRAVAAWAGYGEVFSATWTVAQWPLGVGLGIVALDLVYFLAPAARPRWSWASPGAVVAIAGWFLASLALRIYIAHFADYNATYGSIGTVILLMLWLYVSGAALLVGAQVNAAIASSVRARSVSAAPL